MKKASSGFMFMDKSELESHFNAEVNMGKFGIFIKPKPCYTWSIIYEN